ncbi:MAG TPA: hypothetical protein VKV32_01855 [Stellaceae bacterium]|nr:hypothetical protein [Stellaceae bacterium]
MARASSRRKTAARGAADRLPPTIRFKHKPSGKERRVSTGFAWDLFLFAGILGVPLFWRRLSGWGAAVLVLWLLVVVVGSVRVNAHASETAQLVLFGIFLLLQIGLGFYGNRLTAKTLIHHGWTIEQPNDSGTKRVIEKWKLA